jgi:hypothetical protein
LGTCSKEPEQLSTGFCRLDRVPTFCVPCIFLLELNANYFEKSGSFTCTKYIEERFISNDNPSIKYRKRSGVLVSKASLFKYPLCWSKLHVSSEITHDYPPSHIILSESVKIKRYSKQIGSILIDIKVPASGRPTVEVELLDDSSFDDFFEVCFSLISYFTNGAFVDRSTYDASQVFFSELCKMVSIDPAANVYAEPATMRHDNLFEICMATTTLRTKPTERETGCRGPTRMCFR